MNKHGKICRSGKFGENFDQICDCEDYQYCHQIYGCECKYEDVTEENCSERHKAAFLVLDKTSYVNPKIDPTTAIVVIIVITLIVSSIIYILRKRMRKNKNKG